MKRILKNIISLMVILLLIAGNVFTMYYVYSNKNSSANTNNMESGNNMGTPPDMNNSSESSNDSSNTPPEKPSGETDSSSSMTPPEKPSSESTSTATTSAASTNNTTSSDSNANTSSTSAMPSMPNNSNNETSLESETSSSNKTIIYDIIAFASELCLIVACFMIAYLILSGFNKKAFIETINSFGKVVIWFIFSIILTELILFGEVYVANKYFLNNSSNTQNETNNKSSNSSISYSAANEITSSTTISDKEYKSSTADQNVLSVSGDIDVTASDITVSKTGDSDGGDNTSFYGTNSAIIAKDGATLNLKNITVTTDATGANGVFSYGGSATTNNSSSDGTTINISDSKITTTKDNSGGIMTTGGGITNATNLTVETSGTSSAAIRSDRGGGNVNVDSGTYTTNGQGSPAIYSTAAITVKNAKLISNASEGIVIEGKNSVSIDNTTLTDTNTKLNGESTTYKNIFLYQSMSGDASDGVSEFTAKDSTITTNKGDTFYITNTNAKITLTNNKIVNTDSTGNFLRAKADSWGTSGSNGGTVTLVANNQEINGNIVIDSVSVLDMTLTSSTYEGCINGDNTAESISLTLDKDSKITLTGDSYVTSLSNADSTNSNINFNGYKLYVNGNAIN